MGSCGISQNPVGSLRISWELGVPQGRLWSYWAIPGCCGWQEAPAFHSLVPKEFNFCHLSSKLQRLAPSPSPQGPCQVLVALAQRWLWVTPQELPKWTEPLDISLHPSPCEEMFSSFKYTPKAGGQVGPVGRVLSFQEANGEQVEPAVCALWLGCGILLRYLITSNKILWEVEWPYKIRVRPSCKYKIIGWK